MRYLFGGVLSFLLLGCSVPSVNVYDLAMSFRTLDVIKTESRLAAKSRGAIVKIVSSTADYSTVYGTGTVFKYKGRLVILTAAHVVTEGLDDTRFFSKDGEIDAEVVYVDDIADIAVLAVENYDFGDALSLRPATKRNVKIGERTLYSGYPNSDGVFTIEGYIAGLTSYGDLFLHSYAWPGSSGSSVLGRDGRLIGILSAISVGPGMYGMPMPIEDIVIVVPIWKLNFDLLDLNLKSLDKQI